MIRWTKNGVRVPLLNINGRTRLTLIGILACSMLVFAFLLIMQTPVQAFVSKGASCSSTTCHGATNASAVISVALNGAQGTTLTTSPGSTFEVDWMYTNMRNTTKYDGTHPEIAIPAGWTIARGTANSPALTGWSSTWDLTGGVTTGWNTTYSTATEFPNSPVGYAIDYNGTAWDSGTRNAAMDSGAAGDLDGVANKMGGDARITVPAGATPGTYTIMVLGIGHDSTDTKAHVEQAITVTVASGAPQSPPVSVTGPSSITYPNTGTITYTGGQGTGAMSYSHGSSTGCTVNPSTGVISINNASGTCSVTATKAGDATYSQSTSSPFTVTLNKATPTLSVTNSPVTYDGSAKSATVSGSVAGSVSNILTGGAASQTNAATYVVTANFTPTDTNNYNSLTAASAGNFIINKATASASVTNSPVTYDTTAKAAAVSCAGGGTASNILTGGSATQTNAGSYAVTADCASSANYNAGTGLSAGSFVINKATPTLSVNNSPATYDGSAKSANVSGSVSGSVSSILTGGSASQTNAGTYGVTANFTPTDTTNYNSLTAASAGSFVINQAIPTASVSNTPQTYTGSGQAAAVSCLGGGIASNILTGGSATQTNAGSYAVTADCAASTNYSAATGLSAGSFVINKATPTLSVTNSPATYDGSAKSANVSGSVAGSVSNILTGGAASQIAVGTYAVTADFAPADSINYNSLTAASAGNFVISAATQTATVTNSPVTYNTTPQAAAVTCSGGGSVSNVRYNGSGAVPTNAATYAIVVDCAANGGFAATSDISAGNFIINKASASASVTNSPVTYDTTAKAAAVSCAGGGTASNILTGASATQTNAGTYAVTADCASSTNYNAGTNVAAGNFIIDKSTPTASITNTPVTYSGSAQTATVACLGGGTATLASGGTGTDAGSYPATVNCAASTNYNAASGLTPINNPFVISKATAIASVANSPQVYDGSAKTIAVTCTGGGAVSNITPSTATSVGSYPVTADCASSTNYDAGTNVAAGSFIIDKATPTASITNTPVTYSGSAQTATVACLGGGTATLASGGTGTDAGSYPATVNCAASTNYNAASGLTPINNPFVISKATAIASVANSPQVYDGSAKTIAVTCTGGGAVSNITPSTATSVGSYPVTVDCASSTNYDAGTNVAAGSFVISTATQTASVSNSPVTYTGSQQTASVTCSGGGAVSNVRYDGSTTSPTNAATYAVVVDCGANGGFSATSNVSAGSFVIAKATQTIGTISFNPTTLAISGTTTASATATSGLAVSFTSDTTSICTVSGNTVTGVSAGTCIVRGVQYGDSNFNAADPEVTQSLEVTSGSSTVTVTMAGTGSGTVNSSSIPISPDGIACPGDCIGTYSGGTEVTLMATPDWKSDFVSWFPACTGGSGSSCIFTPNGSAGITATFNFKQSVMMSGPVYYATVQDAYDASTDGILKLRDQTFSEDLVLNRTVSITLDGGYGAAWSKVGSSVIQGSIVIVAGTVTVSDIVLR